MAKKPAKGVTKGKGIKAVNRLMLEHACLIADKIGADTILVVSDLLEDWEFFKGFKGRYKVIFATQDEETYEEASKVLDNVLMVPKVALTRMGQVKMGVIMSLAANLVGSDEKIVCLSGLPKLKTLDSLVVLDISREFELLTSEDVSAVSSGVHPEVFEGVLNLAVELASEGREGNPIGTIFVLGDQERVLPISRQLIINPFKGYPESERNILDRKLRETIKEFSMMDGAFIIREDGVIVSAGRHLAAALDTEKMPMGLGSRHAAAAGITEATDALAIVISQSTGDVRIFKNGSIFMEIELGKVRP
ncbi:MAG: DNA integrity scanning protein DisA nucleotide-binding domain protein [Nitrospinae bacterium]|nr:DNA integrity scanning protein DisA nucleotide-binding domain protein [Nitrospinota bacterium]